MGAIAQRWPDPRAEQGIALIEVLVATIVITVGLLGLVGSFDSARKLTLLSERRSVMAHRAQLEIERLQNYPYGELAMATTPSHSSEKSNPDYYVTVGNPSTFQYGESAGEAESLVVAPKECAKSGETGCGVVGASATGRECSTYVGACAWSDGLVKGYAYDFVTWHTDNNCGAKCPTKENYKRITVVVTATVPAGNREPAPVRISTLVAEPG